MDKTLALILASLTGWLTSRKLTVTQSRLAGKKPVSASWYHPLLLAGLAIFLTLPALGAGLQFDDHLQRQTLARQPDLASALMNFFRFLDHNPAATSRLIEEGLLPWWTLPQLQIAFWRPLAALTHWLDNRLWPQAPLLMHAHSLLWFGALIMVMGYLYRHLFQPIPAGETAHSAYSPWVARLAALLYALDDAHGFPAGWLANRNAVMAALFGGLTLWVYDRWRRGGWANGAWLAPFLFLLGLLSAEAAMATGAYLLAHALFLDQAPWPRRGLALLPFAITGLTWQFIYRWLGYGAYGTAYADPLVEPFSTLAALVERGPLLLLGQFFLPPPELALFLPPPFPAIHWGIALAGLGLLSFLFWPLLREDALARFWAAGLLLATPLACLILPSSRLLFFIGLGGMGLVAQFLGWIWANHRSVGQTEVCPAAGQAEAYPTGLGRWVAALWIVIHLIIAPLLLPLNSYSPALADLEPAIRGLPSGQTLVIVTAPNSFYPAFIPYLRDQAGQTVPARLRLLATGLYPVEVRRLDQRTLRVRPTGGYLLGLDTVFRGASHPLEPDKPVVLPDVTIHITALTLDGRPAEARFQFNGPLETKTWVYWQNGSYHPFPLPQVGEQVRVSTLAWRGN